MGIRHLEKFMKENVPNGFVDVSIVEECRKYRKNHNGEKPTLVFDLMSMTSLVNRDVGEMLYGGRSGKYRKMLEKLFKLLDNEATLVFFSDGPVAAPKYDTWIKRKDEGYQKYLRVIDLIDAGMPVDEIVSKLESYQIPTTSVNSKLIKRSAKAYDGSVTVAVITECDAEIAKYASENPSVLAVLSEDSDFLVFSGQWRYFSVRELNVETLSTKEYSRTALRRFLRLNDSQLAILSTIAGNDVIKYDEVRNVHNKYFVSHRPSVKFPAMAKMIQKEVSRDSYDEMLHNLADFLLKDSDHDSAVERIHKSINQYSTDFKTDDDIDDGVDFQLLQFCRRDRYNSIRTILRGLPKNLTFTYYDYRRNDFPNFVAIMQQIYERMVGIILKHRQPGRDQQQILCEIFTKRSHSEGYQQYFVPPNYPNFDVPPLLQLLDRDTFPEFDEVRFKLMKWSISDSLLNVNLSEIPNEYLLNVLSLYLMVQLKFISIKEADLILLTVKNVELDTIPDDLVYPPVVDERAFRIVFIFVQFYSSAKFSMKTVGLRHLRVPINFDGVFFHKTYLEFNNSGIDPVPLLRDIDHYRIYKDL